MPTNPLRLKHIRSLASPKVKPGVPSSSAVPLFERQDYCQHNHPDKVYQGNMTEKKRQNAKELLKKEEMRSNKAKLAQIICQKLFNRFKRVPKADIRALVHKFVASRAQINANDLTDLENEVREMVKSKRNGEQGGNLPGVNAGPDSGDNKESLFGQGTSGARQQCGCDNCLVGKPCLVLPKGREWEALNMFQAYQAGMKEKKEKEAYKRKQRELKAALDKQVLEAKLRYETEKNEDRRYLQSMTEDLKKFNDEEQARQDRENAKHARQKLFWEKQIAEDNALRQKEREAMIRAEQRDLELMQKKTSEEQRRIQQKKEREAQIHRAILEENAKNKMLHQERMQQEREEDNRIMEEYASRLDAEEKRRQDAFKARMVNLEKIVQIADAGPVGKGRRDQEKQEEELLLKQQLAKEEADARRERNDLHAKLERNRVMAAHNKQLLEEQERLKREAKAKDKVYSDHYKRVGNEYKAEVSRMKQAEQEKCLRQRKVLQDQIDAKRRAEEDMNAVERSINYDTINEIREDATFQSRLQHRVRMARGQGVSSRPHTPNSARTVPKPKQNAWM